MYVDTKKQTIQPNHKFLRIVSFLGRRGAGRGGLTVVFGHMNTH